MKVET